MEGLEQDAFTPLVDPTGFEPAILVVKASKVAAIFTGSHTREGNNKPPHSKEYEGEFIATTRIGIPYSLNNIQSCFTLFVNALIHGWS